MRYICTITRSVGQSRITLPKGFIKAHHLEDEKYLVIDDRDPEKITIGRLVSGEKNNEQGG